MYTMIPSILNLGFRHKGNDATQSSTFSGLPAYY